MRPILFSIGDVHIYGYGLMMALAILSAVPSLLTRNLNMSVPFAASSILIAVSVALETIRTVQGEMSIRGIDMDVEKGGFM